MKSLIRSVLMVTLLLALSACSAVQKSTDNVETSAQSMVSGASMIDQAKAELAMAAKAGCAWRDTGKMIKQAEKLVADGDQEKADKVAANAKRQSENAMKQCATEKERLKMTM